MLPENLTHYSSILDNLKEKIRQARVKAILSVNAQLLQVYWEIGKVILEQQKNEGWGAKIIDRLAADLKVEFPDETGFSVRNLKYMRAFAEAYPSFQFTQGTLAQVKSTENQIDTILQDGIDLIVQPLAAQLGQLPNIQFVQSMVAQISWTHHTIILDKIKVLPERLFYIRKTIENGWSKNILKLQIETDLYQRQGNTINNFELTIPAYESDLVKETFKSPYLFDFLTLAEDAKEKDIERGLIQHLKKFMLELGRGFAYVGNQFNLKVENDEYFLDLLFYNINLHCYVIFELKIGDFKPEHTGKLNFYINTVDGEIKSPKDNPTIGILLCKTPNKTEVKYALKGIDTPLGIAEYELTSSLPKQLKSEMPSITELEAEIEKEYEELKSPAQKKFDALKEKLSGLKGMNEVKQKVSTTVILELYEKSFKPLFNTLLARLQELDKFFYSSTPEYQGLFATLMVKEGTPKEWKDDEFVDRNTETHFRYKLEGFRNAGVDSFNIWLQLTMQVSNYWYGFTQLGYNNQQVFIKKMYHEQLTREDIQNIADVAIEYVTDEIERQLSYIEQRKS